MNSPFKAVLAALLCFPSVVNAQDVGDITYSVGPGDRIAIGRPFDTLTGTFPQADTCLAEFDSGPQAGGQAFLNETFSEVSDTFGVMRALSIDVSASGKIYGTKIEGKFGFAQDTKLQQNSLNYAAFASFKGVPEVISGLSGLNDFGNDQWAQGQYEFRRKCGDAFVATIFTGAEAYAVLSFTGLDEATRRDISAQASAATTNFSGNADLKSSIDEQHSNQNLQIRAAVLSGQDNSRALGASDPAGRWDELVNTIKNLRDLPTANVAFQVLPYSELPNSPGDITPNPKVAELVFYRASYQTLKDTVTPMVNDPFQAEFDHVLRRNADKGAGDKFSLSELQTDLIAGIAALSTLLETCMSWNPDAVDEPSCGSTKALQNSLSLNATPHPYELMTRLPFALEGANRRPYFLGRDELKNLIFTQTIESARNSYCAQSVVSKHPGCTDLASLSQKYLPLIANNLTESPTPKASDYGFETQGQTSACLTAQEAGGNKRLFMQECGEARQRFAWQADGKLRIRSSECIAAPEKEGGGVSSHDCSFNEAQQLWRLIPLDGSNPMVGLLQEAGFGHCLHKGVPKAGQKTFVTVKACDKSDINQIWTVAEKSK